MLVADKIIAPNLFRARKIARGLGDYSLSTNVATTGPTSQVIGQQLQDAVNYFNYVVQQYNLNHFGGQSAEWMANFTADQQAKISGLQGQLAQAQQQENITLQQTQTADAQAQATAQAAADAATAKKTSLLNQIAANTSFLTPSGPGFSITPAGPSTADLLKQSAAQPASGLGPYYPQPSEASTPSISQPTSYAKGAASAQADGLFANLPLWVYIAGASAAVLFFKGKGRR